MCRNISVCKMYVLMLGVCILLYVNLVCGLSYPESPSNDVSIYPFRKMTMDSSGQTIFIGGKNGVLRLNADLSFNYSLDILENNVKENYVQVLIYEEKRDILIMCGTAEQGECIVTNAKSKEKIGSGAGYKLARSNKDDSTIGLIVPVNVSGTTEDVLFVACTYDNEKIGESQQYLITARNLPVRSFIDLLSEFHTDIKPSNTFQIGKKKQNIWKFQFKNMFMADKFLFLLTTVTRVDTNNKFTDPSRIIKMCTFSDIPVHPNSYEDIPIVCKSGNRVYRWIQSGTMVQLQNEKEEITRVLVASFLESESSTSETAVCAYTLDTILGQFLTARMATLYNCRSNGYGDDMYIGVIENRPCCKNENCNANLNSAEFCNSVGGSQRYASILSNETLEGEALLTLEGKHTALAGGQINGVGVVYTGSTSGIITRLNMQMNPGRKIEILRETNLKNFSIGGRIIDIQWRGNDDIFVLTENQVSKLDSTDCSKASGCSQCMGINDAKCGWCITTHKCAERNENCPADFWLSSAIGKCLAVEFKQGIKYQSGDSTTSGKLRLTFTPDIGTVNQTANEKWTCVYNKTQKGQLQPQTMKIAENQCQIELTGDRKYGDRNVDIRYDGETIASTTVLFYQCSLFDTCFNCTVPQTDCYWCPVSAECKDNAAQCQNSIFSQSNVAVSEKQKCPQIIQTDRLIIPNGKPQDLVLNGKNLPQNTTTDGWVNCQISGESFPANVDSSEQVTCRNVEVKYSESKATSNIGIDVKYKDKTSGGVDEDGEGITVEAYKCELLAPHSCSICRSLSALQQYRCDWCAGSGCQFKNSSCKHQLCEGPSIDEVMPENGPIGGGTKITLIGQELGVYSGDIKSVTVSGVACTNINLLGFDVNKQKQRLTCVTGNQSSPTSAEVIVTVNDMMSEKTKPFTYVDPVLEDFSPKIGIRSGGTKITIKGSNINTGNRDKIIVRLTSSAGQTSSCNIEQMKEVNLNEIVCITEGFQNITDMRVSLLYEGGNSTMKSLRERFTYTYDPNITSIKPDKSIESGGMKLTIQGNGFSVLTSIKMTPNALGDSCKKASDSVAYCTIPKKSTRVKREVVRAGSDQTFLLKLDGFEREFHLAYFNDPTLWSQFNKEKIEGTHPKLFIEGENLTLGARAVDYSVTFIATEGNIQKLCDIIEVTNKNLTCTIPELDAGVYHVQVDVGYYRRRVGDINYLQQKLLTYIIVIIALCVTVVVVLALAIILWKVNSKRKNMEIEKIKQDMDTIEMNIKNTSREEFASMQLNMQDVKVDLVSTGIPYNDYQIYTYNLLFPEKKVEDKKLFQFSDEPSDENHRKTAPQALLAFEELLFNKYFLQSLIGTLERQNRFSMKDKAEFSSVLSVVLLGKMQYFYEVVEILLDNLISASASRKQQKTLFRRFDTISKRLLSNWMSLALYPYLKDGGGQQMFMLYKATQTAMEKSPVDAATLCAKDTLVEEKLLKMDVSWCKPMTIKVDLNGIGNVYECQVLNCDTISQTKAKCLYQIYKNKAASQLFHPSECKLDWVMGSGARHTLSDIDISSERRDHYVKYNTLKHYNVKENSHLILKLDDDEEEEEEAPDYENDMKTYKKMKPEDTETTSPTQVLISVQNDVAAENETKWHLVPPDDSKTAHMMDELYLNRLRHTKLMLLDYIKPVFDNILEADKIPPVVHYLFHKLTDMAKDNNIEADIVNSWKSECYGVKVCSEWIKKPGLIFDIFRADHVIPCLEVVQDVLVDIFNQNTPKLSKDSTAQKLLFANEIPGYIKEVRRFYEKTESSHPPSEKEFSDILRTLSNSQAEIKVRKLSGLGKLYAMISVYLVDIISDLDEDENTQSLNLGKKLDNIHQEMDITLNK